MGLHGMFVLKYKQAQRYHMVMLLLHWRSLLIGLAVATLTWPARAEMEICVKQAAQRYQVDERLRKGYVLYNRK